MGRRALVFAALALASCAGDRVVRDEAVGARATDAVGVSDAGVVETGVIDAGVPSAGGAGSARLRAQPNLRRDFCCTEPTGTPFDAAEKCVAQANCGYGPKLICRGMQAPPEIEAREERERKSCRMTCDCICPEDVRQCAMVP